jgi:type IV pilus assembly protein PilQ
MRALSLLFGRDLHRKVSCLLASFLLIAAAPFVAANTLEDIRFSELSAERFEIKMSFSDAPGEPAGYTIEKPARIVLDFADTGSALEQKKFPLSFENSKSAVVLGTEDRTRLIINLESLTTYSSRVEGNVYIVEVGNKHVESYLKETAQLTGSVSTDQKRGDVSVTGIDFRRGESGEGKVIIALSESDVGIDVDQTSEGVFINFSNVWLPQELRRRLDVVDFATPVSFVDTSYDGSRVVLKVEVAGDYDYLAYQADNEYVVSVKPLTEEELEAKKTKFAFVGEKLSLNFQDIEVRSVLQLIADFTELNLVASDTVSGRITLRLDNVPWDQALNLVLKTKGLDKRQIGNVLMVAPAAEIAERERQELETLKQLEELAPLRTEYIRVRYASASEMFTLFEGGSGSSGGEGGSQSTGSVLSERGAAIVDERTNSIIVTDTEERISNFKKLVEQLDIPIRQVLIEARIVIANNNFQEELGVRWGVRQSDVTRGRGDSSRSRLTAGSMEALSSDNFDDDGVWEPTIPQVTTVDLGVNNPTGQLLMGLYTDNGLLTLELSALEDSGHAEIVSQPKLITGDKQLATIESGTEIPYQEASASGATSTSFKEAVLKLEVTPQITPDDRIIMDLKINQDTVGEIDLASGIPTIDVTELNTQVLVGNGQTVVLGGIFQTENSESVSKIPVLGDIPYLGRLFRKDIQIEKKRELIIFITPKILADTVAY